MNEMPRSCKYLAIASIVLLSAQLASFAADLTMFPGKVKALKSPDGKYEILDVDKGSSPDGEQNREILVRKKNAKTSQSILVYHRCVDVAWCPDSSSFLLNDNAGSNVVVPYLFSVSDLKHPVDITPRLMAGVKDKKDRFSIENSDMFSLVFCNRWINRNAAELKVYGAGKKVGCFTIFYEWDLKNNFKKLKRVEEK